MRILFSIILTALVAGDLFAAKATEELDPQLLRIFEQMQAEAGGPELEEKEFEANLTVKVATEKFLIFSDAYLQADEETKYQIGKWMYTPDQIAELKAKRGDVLTVRFKIEEIRTEAPYADMPHFTAKIVSMTPSKEEVDPGGGINSESLRSSP